MAPPLAACESAVNEGYRFTGLTDHSFLKVKINAIMTTSYEKIVIDEDLIKRVLCISGGIDTSDKALAVGIIQEVGPGGNYLTYMSTFERFRSIWTPTISDWESYEDWHRAGDEDVAQRANRKFKQILGEAPENLLDPCVDEQLRDYIARAKR
jgi:trimethylamine--corrinoid protein Co-methyltransferase